MAASSKATQCWGGAARTPAWSACATQMLALRCVCGGLLGAVTGHLAPDTHSMVILASRLPPSRAVRVMGVTDSGLFSGTSWSAVMAFRYHFPDTWRRFPCVRALADPLWGPPPAL